MKPNPENNLPKTKRKARFLAPSYALQAKAPLTDIALGTIVARTNDALISLQEEYLGTLEEERKNLSAAYVVVEQTGGAPEAVALLLCRAQEMRGHSGSVGLDAVCRVCDSLCSLLLGRETVSNRGITIARLHLDALDVILRDWVPCRTETNNGIDEIVSKLEWVVAKFRSGHVRQNGDVRS